MLPERAGHHGNRTGEELLSYTGRLSGMGRAAARARARELLDDVGLGERRRSLIGGYSRGMRQRLGIAQALVNDPAVVFLDEPTLGWTRRGSGRSSTGTDGARQEVTIDAGSGPVLMAEADHQD